MNKQWIKKGLTGIMVVGLVLMTITLTAWADTTAIEGLWERRAGEVLRITGEEGFFQEASHSGLRYFPIQVGDMKLKGITFTEENVWATTSLQWFTSGGEARSAWSETATLTLEDGGQTLSLNTHTTHPFTGRLIRSQVKYQRLEGSPVPVTEEEPIPATEPEVEEKPAIVVESGDISSEVFDSGIRMGWSKNDQALGYRVFRSTSQDDLGLSVTDFYITATRFVDVNVEPDTEYHYTVLPVLAEAKH